MGRSSPPPQNHNLSFLEGTSENGRTISLRAVRGEVDKHVLTQEAPFQKHSPTSKAAAQQQNKTLGVKQAAVLRRIYESGTRGITDNELSDYFVTAHGWSIHTARPRRCELTSLGKVVDSGSKHKGSTLWIAREYVTEQAA